ncbi:MAG: amidase, partial [Actinobacteria bacterium]|nr:amidase [Actinomycetota bacterium]
RRHFRRPCTTAWAEDVRKLGAASLPCGFDQDGMPLGLQLVGPLRADRELLQVAALFEMASGLLNQRPMI